MIATKPMIDMLHRMNNATGERWFACRDALIADIERQAEELAAANEAREKAERERDVARENARVRSGEALDYYSAMLNFAHEFGAKDGDNMIEVIGNGIDALRAEGERLREAIRHLLTVVQVDPDCAECAAAEELIAAIDAARKEA